LDIREIVQAVVGVLILKPDQVLVNDALGSNSAIAGTASSHSAPLAGELTTLVVLVHPLVIILGFGLLIGMGLSVSTIIAFFVGIGAGAGLFEAGALLKIFGAQVGILSAPFNGASSVLSAYPILSDLFIVFPLILLSIGVFAWSRKKRAKKIKSMNTVHSHLRHYCVFCGAHIEVGRKDCRACGSPVSKAALDSYCTSCGRPASRKGKHCAYCGELILKDESMTCPSCNEPTSRSATYCQNCGVRIGTTTTPLRAAQDKKKK
jgi:hypothetical protein